jgi:hypothetical protein
VSKGGGDPRATPWKSSRTDPAPLCQLRSLTLSLSVNMTSILAISGLTPFALERSLNRRTWGEPGAPTRLPQASETKVRRPPH